jgi:exonuclease III
VVSLFLLVSKWIHNPNKIIDSGQFYAGIFGELILKLTTIRRKIKEANCDIICLQETKKELFYQSFIRKFCPVFFDRFEYIRSIEASSGTIIIWKSERFSGQVISQNEYAMSVEFVSMISGAVWVLTNVYAPCIAEGKVEFLNWLHDLTSLVVISKKFSGSTRFSVT